MIPGRQRAARKVALLGLMAAALLFSGCVYLRLLEVKRQLGDFDRHFRLETRDGLSVICQTPVLLTGDVRWMGLKPENTKKLGAAEQWQVRWVKQLPQGVTEAETFDIILELTFADTKLTRIAIPERYFALMPKSFLIGIIKSVGGAKIDRGKREVAASVLAEELRASQPKLPAINQLLGQPSERRIENRQTIVRYRYVPVTKESRAGVFDMTLHFDTATGVLQKWHGHTPIGNIGFDFTADK